MLYYRFDLPNLRPFVVFIFLTIYLSRVVVPCLSRKGIGSNCYKHHPNVYNTTDVGLIQINITPRLATQFVGTTIAGTVNLLVAWWLLTSIENICHKDILPPNSPWKCPNDRVFFDASVIWGLVGPKRIFGPLGNYSAVNWFFLGGLVGPVLVWLLHKAFPKQTWIPLINLPVLLGATAYMPPATALNYNAWMFVGTIFNFFVFRYRKDWWRRYNYVLSAAMDAGVAFMAVLLYFSVGIENKSLHWWGSDPEHCPLATCPTAKGIVVDGCPTF